MITVEELLRPYRVTLHEDAGDKFTIIFDCLAEDADHAAEQAKDMYPRSEIVSTFEFDGAEPPKPTKHLWSVAVYMVDRVYGGPEEGGWYYTAGLPDTDMAQFTRLFKGQGEEAPAAARRYRDRLAKRLVDKLNVGRRDIGSVLSEGQYMACLEEGYPAAFPQERPHYE